MTWVAVIFLPVVLGYQSWSYWVFRKRITREHIEPTLVPAGRPGRRLITREEAAV